MAQRKKPGTERHVLEHCLREREMAEPLSSAFHTNRAHKQQKGLKPPFSVLVPSQTGKF